MRKKKRIDLLLIVSMIFMAISGFAIPFLKEMVWIGVGHKMFSILFCILCVMHILQYKRGRGGKKNVS